MGRNGGRVQPSSIKHFSCAQPYTTITRATAWERQYPKRRAGTSQYACTYCTARAGLRPSSPRTATRWQLHASVRASIAIEAVAASAWHKSFNVAQNFARRADQLKRARPRSRRRPSERRLRCGGSVPASSPPGGRSTSLSTIARLLPRSYGYVTNAAPPAGPLLVPGAKQCDHGSGA